MEGRIDCSSTPAGAPSGWMARTAVEKMLASGLPVLQGTGQHGSQTDLFLGNGDILELE